MPETTTYLWSVVEGDLALSDATLRTPVTNPVLVFRPGALRFGSVYVLQLTVTDFFGVGSSDSPTLSSRCA
jgi:hypothetical protein